MADDRPQRRLPVLALGGQVSSAADVREAWYFACTSDALDKSSSKSPHKFELFDLPLVLFRDAQGKAAALLDRCPHRNVPLSKGRVRAGEIECAYHGWRFDGQGRCTLVPGLCDEAADAPARRAGPFATHESQGLVWVWATPDQTPSHGPHLLEHLGAPGYTCVIQSFEVDGSVHALAENTLDVPHTAFLHGGLFRDPGAKKVVEVQIYRGENFVEARFIGEQRPGGLIGKLLAPKGGEVEHTDRFRLPSICEVDYRLGEDSHINVCSLITPLGRNRSRLTAVLCLRLPVPGWVLKPILKPLIQPIARKIFAQDAVILSAQSASIERFGGERFVSTPIDALGPEILRLLRRAERGQTADPERASQDALNQPADKAPSDQTPQLVRSYRLAL